MVKVVASSLLVDYIIHCGALGIVVSSRAQVGVPAVEAVPVIAEFGAYTVPEYGA
jgi:hypothetical protein